MSDHRDCYLCNECAEAAATKVRELEDKLRIAGEALEAFLSNPKNCGCESGDDLDPPFECGYHKALAAIKESK